jgi:hypothetical protein
LRVGSPHIFGSITSWKEATEGPVFAHGRSDEAGGVSERRLLDFDAVRAEVGEERRPSRQPPRVPDLKRILMTKSAEILGALNAS